MTVGPMRRGFLVTFSGIDGSGKSSQAAALAGGLAKRKLSVARAWAGHKPTFSYPFLALMRVLGYTHRKNVEGMVFVWRDIKRNGALSKLWPLFVALDFVPKAIVSVKLPLWRGRIVVCDRYLYDVFAELRDEGLFGRTGESVLLGLLPRPDVAFLMDVDDRLAWERAMVPGRAREQPIYDIPKRRGVYLRLAEEFGLVVLDGADDPALNRAHIITAALEALGKRDIPGLK